ncbi:hypothetical protein O181_049300 [Austropuccinia psidii MF-1]|uniref:Uncharacterized protein n=1 Tax=Austropuccinia psidii MF-1 TaxID=1389203 RepID=A0A9Q3DYW4_9BASI|nr:hypothetical protein [Austropuccinia psidii MF-1]
MSSYVHIASFLGQEKTIELLEGWSPFSCKYKVKNINNWLEKEILLSLDQKKELEVTPTLEKEGPVASNSSKPAPEQSKYKQKGPQRKHRRPRAIKEREKAKPIGTDLTHKGTGFLNWKLQRWTVYSIWQELL